VGVVISKTGMAGTMESSDIMITLEPGVPGRLDIDLNSAVEKQFGRQIREVIAETLTGLGVAGAKVVAVDKGALDCVIRARVKAAAYRAADSVDYDWGGGPE
jgi:citrate lyase subunit gamma (acyl carrier protein)